MNSSKLCISESTEYSDNVKSELFEQINHECKGAGHNDSLVQEQLFKKACTHENVMSDSGSDAFDALYVFLPTVKLFAGSPI